MELGSVLIGYWYPHKVRQRQSLEAEAWLDSGRLSGAEGLFAGIECKHVDNWVWVFFPTEYSLLF